MSGKLNIRIPEALVASASSGGGSVAAGDYSVRVATDSGTIFLSGPSASADIPLTAMRRDSKMQVKKDSAQLFAVEKEPAYLLVIRTPPNAEWVVRLEKAGTSAKP